MNSKVEESDKFYSGPRIFGFPRNSFVELTLSDKDARKVRLWMKEGVSVVPIWNVNCNYVLFVNEAKFKALKKH